MSESPSRNWTRAHGQAEGVGGDLGHGRVRAGAHVAGGGLHQGGAVGVEPD